MIDGVYGKTICPSYLKNNGLSKPDTFWSNDFGTDSLTRQSLSSTSTANDAGAFASKLVLFLFGKFLPRNPLTRSSAPPETPSNISWPMSLAPLTISETNAGAFPLATFCPAAFEPAGAWGLYDHAGHRLCDRKTAAG